VTGKLPLQISHPHLKMFAHTSGLSRFRKQNIALLANAIYEDYLPGDP